MNNAGGELLDAHNRLSDDSTGRRKGRKGGGSDEVDETNESLSN